MLDSALLNHLLDLAAKTGDRLIVVDPNSRQPFVLMGLAQYEALVGPSLASVSAPAVDLVVQRANTELAAWRAAEGVPTPAIAESTPAVAMGGFVPEPTTAALPDDDRFYVEPLE